MNNLWLAGLLSLTVASPVLAGGLEPFPGVDYSSVKAFYFNAKSGRPECTMPLNKDGSLCSSVEGPGKLLSKKQADTLRQILNEPSSYQRGFARCFIPHHALVFFNTKGKPVAQVSLCFKCHQLLIEPSQPRRRSIAQAAQHDLQDLCVELGLKNCRKN